MKASIWTLLLLVVLPGAALIGSGTYFLSSGWAMLTMSHQNYQELATLPTSILRNLAIAEAAENCHRINCFAQGVGVLLDSIIFSIGFQSICTLST